MKLHYLLLVNLFIFCCTSTPGQSKLPDSNVNKPFLFTPNKTNLGYVYNRAIDIIMHRHAKVFVSMSETDKIDPPIFDASKDSVLIDPEIYSTYTLFSPRFMDSLCNYQSSLITHKANKLLKSLIFNNNFIIKVKNANNGAQKRDGNIYVKFSNLVQLNNKLSFRADIDWMTKEGDLLVYKVAALIFELELCSDNYIMFRKLYTNYFGTLNAGEPGMEVQKKKELPNHEDDTPLQIYSRDPKSSDVTYFYEISLWDKSCDE